MTEKGTLKKMIRKIRRYTQEFKDEAFRYQFDGNHQRN
jgi:hypothetical protein